MSASESLSSGSTPALAQAEEALARGVVGVPTEWDVITVEGPDAASYLQGQMSQNVEALPVGATAWSFLLQPQGKVDAWGRLHRVGDQIFWFVVDVGFGPSALARLQRFKLRVEAELSAATVAGLALRGPQAHQVGRPGGSVAVSADWDDLVGVDVMAGPDSDGPMVIDSVTTAPVELLTVLRARYGIPAMGAELDDNTIPGASRVVNRSTDFTKGCYVGQELVARIDSRGGNTPTRLVRFSFPTPVAVGTELVDEAGGEPVATVTTAAWSPSDGAIGLGYLARKVTDPTTVRTPDGAAVTVTEVAEIG